MRILITGASGFIGKNFLRKLRFDNCDILATATTERNIQINDYEKVKWVFGDLSDIDFVRTELIKFDPEVLVHLAWNGIPNYTNSI